MPDLKSELAKVINSWDTPKPEPTAEAKPYFSVTNNVCRATFECIVANPGKTRTQISKMLEKQGYKKSSTTSLMGQMVKQGLVRDANGLVYANSTKYVPLKSAKVWANHVAKQTEKSIKTKPLRLVKQPVQETPQINSTWDADVMLNSLNIVQARALYDSLRKIFGGGV